VAELTRDEPKMATRPPFRTGKIPKERGEYKELTGGFGREVEASTEEIDAARRSSGGLLRAAALRMRGREEERCERCRGGCRPFIARKGAGEGARRRWAVRSVAADH
jgi:hypothetical protein